MHISYFFTIFARLMHRKYYILYLLLLVCAFTACTPRAVREAESVVAQADSLRAEGQMYGIDEGDSTTLAQAYEALEAIPLPFREGLGLGSSYAHACYHYGRLLREKDNPVEAMQVFISATHSRTHDYHILGRVYSNMGEIAHLASEFQLSYDMFERSADMFLQEGDTMAYYYDVNRMAFEKADLADSAACLLLIQKLKNIPNIYELTSITKAELFTKIQLYDSAIYYANILIDSASYTPTCALIKANAFSYLGKNDSALVYAHIVIADTLASYQNKFNALYFISHLDSALSVEEIQLVTSLREDIRYYEYEPDKEKLTQAVQLLNQDLNRKPDWRWLYAILATIVIIGTCISIYIYRKRRQHALLSQKVKDLNIQNNEAETKHEKIINDLEKHKRDIADDIERHCYLITQAKSFPQNICWNKYNKMCTVIDKQFYLLASKLRTKYKS